MEPRISAPSVHTSGAGPKKWWQYACAGGKYCQTDYRPLALTAATQAAAPWLEHFKQYTSADVPSDVLILFRPVDAASKECLVLLAIKEQRV